MVAYCASQHVQLDVIVVWYCTSHSAGRCAVVEPYLTVDCAVQHHTMSNSLATVNHFYLYLCVTDRYGTAHRVQLPRLYITTTTLVCLLAGDFTF